MKEIQLGQEAIFWFFFFFFNFVIFIYFSIIDGKASSFIPFKRLFKSHDRGVFVEHDPDFYRICVDVSLLILLYRYGVIRTGQTASAIYFAFLLLYNIYHYSFSKIYQVVPVLSNDARLIANAAGILWGESKVKVFFGVLLTSGAVLLIAYGFREYLYFSIQQPTNYICHAMSALVALYVMAGILKKGIRMKQLDTAHRILIMPARIFFNISSSWKLIKKMNSLNTGVLEKQRNVQLNLAKKPNIYCIFIESYGSILLKEDCIKDQFVELFTSLKSSLDSQGWILKNNYSESVTPVGPSWLAYTSVLFGKNVANNFEYEFLLNQEKIHKYDTLIKVFMKEGYKSHHLNPSKPTPGVKVPYKQIDSFYGIDKWIKRDDIPFKGKTYGFIESPPDQYVMNYAYHDIIKQEQDPFILFFLTKNSHSPYISPESIVKDWRSLNGEKDELIGYQFLRKPNLNDYLRAIKYQLECIGDFITSVGQKNDIFLFIGDHQPHELGNHKKYGKETLMHIVSKNQEFIDGFNEYGFKDTLDNLNEPIKHEAIHSMFIREIAKTYGSPDSPIPPYEPNGIQF